MRLTSYLFGAAALAASFANADMVEPPSKFRINTDLIKRIFNKGDQRVLEVFQDREMGEIEIEGVAGKITSMTGSLVPEKDINEFDFDLFFGTEEDNEDNFMGFRANALTYAGVGTYLQDEQSEAVEFTFEGKVNKMLLEVELTEADKEVLVFNENAKIPNGKEPVIEIGEITVQSDVVDAAFAPLIRESAEKSVRDTYEFIMSGELDAITKLPVESFIPFLFLRHMANFAQKFELLPNTLEYGFNPEQIQRGINKLAKIPERKQALLKEIHSEFTEAEEGDDLQAVSMIFDENFVNSLLLDLVLIDSSQSLRDYMMRDPRGKLFVQQLNTSTLGLMLPQITEEFGAGKDIDLLGTLSHSYVSEKLDNAKVSGFQMDKNGNFRFIINAGFQIIVDKNKFEKEEARAVFFTFTAKGKVVITKPDDADLKEVMIYPKNLEISNVKIFQGEEEMVMEQMLVMSAINVQLEQLTKILEPKSVPLKNPPNPKEFECLGFRLSDFNILFRKSYVEVVCSWEPVDEVSDPEYCEDFFQAMRNGPDAFVENAKEFYNQYNEEDNLDEYGNEIPQESASEEGEPEQIDIDATTTTETIIHEDL